MTVKIPGYRIFALLLIAIAVFFSGCSAQTEAASPEVLSAADSSIVEPVNVQNGTAINMVVRHLSGEAYVLRGGDRFSLSVDDAVFEGDSIITGTDSVVVLNLKGGRQIWVAADSLLEVASLTGDENGEKTALFLHDGNVVSVIDEKLEDADSYDVETPGLIMAIRGTIASVSHDARTEKSGVAFFEGSGLVESKTRADVMVVSRGECVTGTDGRLDRGVISVDTLREGERLFLFDEAYGEKEDRERIGKRLEAFLNEQESAAVAGDAGEEPLPPLNGQQDSGDDFGEDHEQQDEAGETAGDDFFSIKQEFIQAQKDFGSGRIGKEEFLAIKQKFIDAKAAYNSR